MGQSFWCEKELGEGAIAASACNGAVFFLADKQLQREEIDPCIPVIMHVLRESLSLKWCPEVTIAVLLVTSGSLQWRL